MALNIREGLSRKSYAVLIEEYLQYHLESEWSDEMKDWVIDAVANCSEYFSFESAREAQTICGEVAVAIFDSMSEFTDNLAEMTKREDARFVKMYNKVVALLYKQSKPKNGEEPGSIISAEALEEPTRLFLFFKLIRATLTIPGLNVVMRTIQNRVSASLWKTTPAPEKNAGFSQKEVTAFRERKIV